MFNFWLQKEKICMAARDEMFPNFLTKLGLITKMIDDVTNFRIRLKRSRSRVHETKQDRRKKKTKGYVSTLKEMKNLGHLHHQNYPWHQKNGLLFRVLLGPKGQIISEWLLNVFIRAKIFQYLLFLPKPLKWIKL